MQQTELHRHLDASLRTSTLHELALERGLTSHSLEKFSASFLLKQPLPNLESVLSRFELFQKVLDSEPVLRRIAFEGVEDCYREGTRKVEYRFSPGFIGQFNQLKWEWILDAIQQGVQDAKLLYPEMQVGLLCIASRDQGLDEVNRTVDFFLNTKSAWVGFDLAGPENQYPPSMFLNSFLKLRNEGVSITIHAGEGTSAENIWSAILDLGAKRIGHGTAALNDPILMDYLRDQQICLELCPTSNWITSITSDLSRHPLRTFFDHGIPVCLNTDDPGIFGNTLLDEIKIAKQKMDFTDDEIQKLWCYAEAASFT